MHTFQLHIKIGEIHEPCLQTSLQTEKEMKCMSKQQDLVLCILEFRKYSQLSKKIQRKLNFVYEWVELSKDALKVFECIKMSATIEAKTDLPLVHSL